MAENAYRQGNGCILRKDKILYHTAVFTANFRKAVDKMGSSVIAAVQLCFTVIIGLYFFSMLKSQYSSKNSIYKESTKELERLIEEC